MAYDDIIEYLYGLQRHGVKLGLSNTIALMERLGGPHKKFRSVHITGTNGKGSTAAFIVSVLGSAGYRTGLYTSPHLVSFTERMRIDNIPISEERVVSLAKRVRDASLEIAREAGGGFSPTFFEVTTAMAFTYFAEEGVDIAVVEVGMGGRLDATNVITPLVSVITNIDLEHTEFLGDTIEKIAAEKAGIIKHGVPVVTAVSQREAAAVIEARAADMSTSVFKFGRDFWPRDIISENTQSFHYQGIRASIDNVEINMLGLHQVQNACLAIAAVECVRESGMNIPESSIRQGLEQARWEGRLELAARRPDLYLDGAHNPASARALAGALSRLKKKYNRLVLVIGILADKDYKGMLSELLPPADHVIATRPQYSRGMDHQTLAAEIGRMHTSVSISPRIEDALQAALAVSSPDDLIVVTGSLYVVGEARGLLKNGDLKTSALRGLKG